MPDSSIISARDLTRAFDGGVVAVNGFDLTVGAGSVFGLIGRNGCGKTTVLRVLLGLLKADRGSTRMLGCDFWNAPSEVRQQVAYVPQENQLPGWMTIAELTRYLGHFYTMWDESLAQKLAKAWELPWTRRVGTMSLGEQRKVALMLAFVSHPKVMVLDEPAAGFDVMTRLHLIELIIETVSQFEPCTVLLSTHIISDLERVASHIGVMDRGALLRTGELDSLREEFRRIQVVFDLDLVPADFKIPGSIDLRVEGPVATAVVDCVDEDIVLNLSERWKARVNEFPMSIEEIFVTLLKRQECESKDALNERNGFAESAVK